MMYLKLNADYKQGELVPLLDDAIYVYCDVCKSLHRIEDVSHAAFGSCSFEQLNACEKCSEELQKEDEKKQIAEALGWSKNKTIVKIAKQPSQKSDGRVDKMVVGIRKQLIYSTCRYIWKQPKFLTLRQSR